ncbi:MAG: HAMP domain-containing protein, partial [Phormidium sp.]
MRSPIAIRHLFRFPQEISLRFLLVALLVLQIILSISIILIVPELNILATINHTTEKIILVSIIAGILAAIGGSIIAHWVTKPILLLKIAAKKMASGDLEQTIKIAGVSEVKELADSFNSMAKQLQVLLADLVALNTDLSQNERRLIQFLEALPWGVLVQDTEGNIVYHNQTAQRLT